jgi:AcrR family transcriptional regulator
VDAAERLLAEGDPLLVTFDQVADVAGVSRPLVHAYLGDRRGLLDAVQVRIVGRMDAWVGHGLRRAPTGRASLQAIAGGLFAFVDAEQDAWSVLVASGGLDHPALHGVRGRWAERIAATDRSAELPAQAAVAALVFGVGGWVHRGVDPHSVVEALERMCPS